MNIEDCEVGKEVIRTGESFGAVKKGETYTISSWIETNAGYPNVIKFEELSMGYDMNKFELKKPANKFEVGDEVVWDNGFGDTFIVEILVIVENESWLNKNIGIRFKNDDGNNINRFVKLSNLSPLKKKDELEVGDKFKVKTAEGTSKRINEVLGIFKDEYYNQTKYAAKRLNGNYEGFVDIYNSEMIAEIIYE